MESSEEAKGPGFSHCIDSLASEYGWTLEQIFDLTSDQMALMLIAGDKRRRELFIAEAGRMRLAVASVMSKEGARAFEGFIRKIKESGETVEKVTSKESLGKLGMEVK